MPGIEIRRLRTNEEYGACVRLQKATWGADFSEEVPLAILKVGQRIGGVTAGAFDGEGRMLGFVFGLTGVEEGRPVHWSDMLAVLPEARNLGIGQRLKAFQREELERLGVGRVYWTYDPLVARNAHLNLNRLGARVAEYAVDMYGADTSSELHRGLGTDRLVIAWEIGAGAAGRPAAPADDRGALPLVEAPGGEPAFRPAALAAMPPALTVEVPAEIEAVQARSLDEAAAWRRATRQGFLTAHDAGYRVAGFVRAAGPTPPRYLLRPDPS